jgi:hypothetical protein
MGGKGRPQTLETHMTDKFMTAAVFAALAFTLATLAGTPEPFARGGGQNGVGTASSESPTVVVKVSTGNRQLSGYHDPHDRKRNIATRGVSSCWVQTRYGTVNICGTDGGDD